MQVLRHGEVEGAALASILETFVQNPGWGWVFRGRDVKGKRIGKDAGSEGDGQPALGQGFGIDLNLTKAPGAGIQGVQVESRAVFNEALLRMQVLGREKRAFGPDNGLKLSHFLQPPRLSMSYYRLSRNGVEEKKDPRRCKTITKTRLTTR